MFTSTASKVRNCFGLLVLFSSLFLTACDNSNSGSVISDETGATQLAFSAPEFILQSRIATEDLILEILVDGTPVPLTRNEAGQWVGNTMIPSNSNVVVTVNWSEDFPVEDLMLATATKELNIAADATSAELRFRNNEFNTFIDTDGDGLSNLAERNDNYDPFSAASPGPAIDVSTHLLRWSWSCPRR